MKYVVLLDGLVWVAPFDGRTQQFKGARLFDTYEEARLKTDHIQPTQRGILNVNEASRLVDLIKVMQEDTAQLWEDVTKAQNRSKP